MLGKLFGHEMRATGRIFLPLYLALLVLTVLMKPFISFDNLQNSGSDFIDFFFIIISLLYGLVIGAIMVMTVILTVQRFYKNLLGQEGYLMMVLPVKSWQHITAKMLAAFIWAVVSMIVVIISGLAMGLSLVDWQQMLRGLPRFMEALAKVSAIDWFNLFLSFLIIVFGMLMMELLAYLSISIGHLFQRFKMAIAFVSFVVIINVYGTLINFLSNIVPYAMADSYTKTMLLGLSCIVLGGAAFFFGTKYIMDKHLNLE